MMNGRAIPGVIDQMEILYSLVNAGDVYRTSRVDYISSNLTINLDELLHVDFLYFISR